jgi:hypothetical protein
MEQITIDGKPYKKGDSFKLPSNITFSDGKNDFKILEFFLNKDDNDAALFIKTECGRFIKTEEL